MTMADQEQSVRDLLAVLVQQHPLAIAYLVETAENNFEMRSGFIQSLPKFTGRATEDPYRHLQQFHMTCTTMKPQRVDLDLVKLKAFPFSLEDTARDWFCYLAPGTITTWPQMSKVFLEKYFPSTRVATLKKQIYGAQMKEMDPTRVL